MRVHDTFVALLGVWLILLVMGPTSAVDVASHPHEFCYSYDECSPISEQWADTCKTGKKQSPIDLKATSTDEEMVDQPLHRFQCDHFFIQNNGHTVNIDFPIQHEEGDTYFFPGYGLTKTKYRLSNAHFHWGKTDSDGSEHALEGKRFAMEMHLVHYNEKYGSAAKAIKSGDADALSVIGIFFNAVKGADPNPALAPILKGIASIKDVHSYWVKVEEPIDMMPLLPHRGDPIFHYKGSLTTPTCNEQVNWYVFKTPITVSPSDVNAFRSLVDGHNRTLIENHRPVQSLGSRDVKMLKVH